MQGRYGPYVTDGVTNASLPRTITPEEVTFEYALNLLAERAAAGPSKRSSRRAAKTKTTAAKTKKSPKKPAAPAAKPRKTAARGPRQVRERESSRQPRAGRRGGFPGVENGVQPFPG